MNFLQLKKTVCFIESTLEEDGYEDAIAIHYLDENLYFMWMVNNNMLSIELPCKSENNRKNSIITTFWCLEDVIKTCSDYIGSVNCWININPKVFELNVGDFRFSFDMMIDARSVWGIPKNWEFEENYDVLADLDLAGWKSLFSAAAIANQNKTKNKSFPAMQGVNINCFAEIMEIAAVNSTVAVYKYIKTNTEADLSFSFTISPKAIFLLDTLLEAPGEGSIRIRVNHQKFISFACTTELGVVSVTTPFIQGIYTYPRIPINNVSINRIPVCRTHLMDALDKKKQEYEAHYKLGQFDSVLGVTCNQININVSNNLALIKSYAGEIIYVLSIDKDVPDSSFWTDIWQLSDILGDLDEKIFFILPEQEHEGLFIETDTCQYTVMGLVKRDRLQANCAFDDPVYKKVLHSCPGLRASEPTLEIILTEFPIQEHIFKEWEIKARQYNADYPYSQEIANIHQEALEEQSEDLCENLDYLYQNYQKNKGEVGASLKLIDTLIGELRDSLEDKMVDNTTTETLQAWQSLIQAGILLRGRIIGDHLALERTYRVEMTFK